MRGLRRRSPAITPFDPLIQQYETVLSDLRSLIAEVWGGSPTGDAGMHDRFKVFPENLEKLVEYDLKLVDTARAILDSAKSRLILKSLIQ